MTMQKALHPRDDVYRRNQEKREEKDLQASKIVLTHRYNDSKIIYKNTMEDSLQPSETILITQ